MNGTSAEPTALDTSPPREALPAGERARLAGAVATVRTTAESGPSVRRLTRVFAAAMRS